MDGVTKYLVKESDGWVLVIKAGFGVTLWEWYL